MKNFLSSNWIRIVAGLIIGVAAYILYLLLRNVWGVLLAHIDGLFFAFALVVLIGLLVLMTNLGALDIFSYQFGRKRLQSGRKEDFYEYTQRKKETRAKYKFSFIAYFISSIPFLISFIILYAILSNSN